MKKIINKIRQQPEHVRTHLLHVLTIIAGIILVLLWVYSLGTTLNDSDTQAQINNSIEPFSALKATVIDGYHNISTPE